MKKAGKHIFKAITAVVTGAVVLSAASALRIVPSVIEPVTVYADQEQAPGKTEAKSSGLSDGASVTDNGGVEKTGDEPAPDAELSQILPFDLFDNGYNYSAVVYDNKNGMPTSEANAIVQTSEGFIWIGSYGGLVRYDGNRFERVAVDGISGVKSLYHDSKKRLWIGATSNGAAMMDNGAVRYWGEDEGFVSGAIYSISEDSGGTVYIASRNGLAYFDGDSRIVFIDDERIKDKSIRDMKKGNDGLVYVLDADNNVFTVRDGKVQGFCSCEIIDAVCILPDPENPGNLIVCWQNSAAYCEMTNDKLVTKKTFGSDILSNIQDIEYIGSKIWICTGKGIYLSFPDDYKTLFRLQNLPPTSLIGHVMQDHQGNYWLTSSRQGIMKIVPNYFDDIYADFYMDDNVVNSVCMYNDQLLSATDTGIDLIDINGYQAPIYLEELYYDGSLSRISDDKSSVSDFFRNMRIRSAVCTSDHSLWISTTGDGLYCIEGKRVYRFDSDADNEDERLSSNRLRTVREAKDGSLLIIGKNGLDIMKNRKVIRSYGEKDGIRNTDILSLEEGLNDDILLGSNGDGIYVIDKNGSVKNLGKKYGLTSGDVMRIKKDRKRDIFWIITEDSIAYMTGDYNITAVTHFPCKNNFDLYQNSKDDTWVLSCDGIYVVPTEQMISDEDNMNCEYYGTANGLMRITTANSYSALTSDGELYIAGNTGVTMVNIDEAFQEPVEIKIAVPFVEADGTKLYPDKNGDFTIPSHVIKLTVYAYVFNYSLTTPQITYRLDGLDSRKTTVSQSTLVPIDYTNLHGGEYSFVIDAADLLSKRQYNQTVKITKEKYLYEEVWFWIIIVISSILIVAGIFMLIMYFRMKKLNKKNRDSMLLVHEISEAFAKVIDMKDAYTNGHSTRVAKYTAMLAEELGYNKETIEKFYHIALLHDIGKVGVPSEVLNKPGKLTDEEFQIIKSHTSMGYETLEGISIMPELALGAQAHHERPDGKGYPNHLKGDEIPRVAQIIAVADCFDAMYSNRPYRKRMNFEKAVSIIKEASGSQLTADVVEAFLRLVDKGEFRAPDDEGGGTTENIENIRGS